MPCTLKLLYYMNNSLHLCFVTNLTFLLRICMSSPFLIFLICHAIQETSITHSKMLLQADHTHHLTAKTILYNKVIEDFNFALFFIDYLPYIMNYKSLRIISPHMHFSTDICIFRESVWLKILWQPYQSMYTNESF